MKLPPTAPFFPINASSAFITQQSGLMSPSRLKESSTFIKTSTIPTDSMSFLRLPKLNTWFLLQFQVMKDYERDGQQVPESLLTYLRNEKKVRITVFTIFPIETNKIRSRIEMAGRPFYPNDSRRG